MAAAAARYGHVMHPETATEPSVALAQRLLHSAGSGWANRVFYSDDGCALVQGRAGGAQSAAPAAQHERRLLVTFWQPCCPSRARAVACLQPASLADEASIPTLPRATCMPCSCQTQPAPRCIPVWPVCRSTAIEVALRMALRRFRADHGGDAGAAAHAGGAAQLHVVGLAEGYHGDTLGATDAVAPSVYNGPQHYPWWAPVPTRRLLLTVMCWRVHTDQRMLTTSKESTLATPLAPCACTAAQTTCWPWSTHWRVQVP